MIVQIKLRRDIVGSLVQVVVDMVQQPPLCLPLLFRKPFCVECEFYLSRNGGHTTVNYSVPSAKLLLFPETAKDFPKIYIAILHIAFVFSDEGEKRRGNNDKLLYKLLIINILYYFLLLTISLRDFRQCSCNMQYCNVAWFFVSFMGIRHPHGTPIIFKEKLEKKF